MAVQLLADLRQLGLPAVLLGGPHRTHGPQHRTDVLVPQIVAIAMGVGPANLQRRVELAARQRAVAVLV